MKKSLLVFVLVSFFLSGCAKEKHLTLPKGQLIVFASQQGEPSWDGVSKESKNSPFTVALLENLNKQEDINFVLRKVRQQVLDLTKQKQQPVAYDSFTDGSLVLATINRVGGFVVTDRMLEMFKPKKSVDHGDDK